MFYHNYFDLFFKRWLIIISELFLLSTQFIINIKIGTQKFDLFVKLDPKYLPYSRYESILMIYLITNYALES